MFGATRQQELAPRVLWCCRCLYLASFLERNFSETPLPIECIPGRHAMNVTLLKALVALVPVGMLLYWSVVGFFRGKTLCSVLQLLGAGCLVVVILTHISEALQLLPWMHWGLPNSVGHYLDLWSAVLGLTLFPIGYLCHRFRKRPA